MVPSPRSRPSGLLAAQLLLLVAGILGLAGGGAGWAGAGPPKERHLDAARHALAIGAPAAPHARAALAEAPANGYAWLALAIAEDRDGDRAAARRALSASWRWTPAARSLAPARVALAGPWWPDLPDAERGALLAELNLARQRDAAAFARRIADTPRLAALWRLAQARQRG